MKRGFTLIELMIVVAIIAIIATIAIPNLMESRKSANESNAIAALKHYATAQHTFLNNNYSNANSASYPNPTNATKCYAPSWQNLGGTIAVFQDAAGNNLNLISSAFAHASDIQSSYRGYYFGNIANNSNNISYSASDWKFDFGLGAVPAVLGTTGRSAYAVDAKGTILMQDAETGGVDGDPTLGGTMVTDGTGGWQAAQ
jgi:prepilin-type N-terminal cleavage/methylation domain-containing protein